MSVEFTALKMLAATAPPTKSATRKIQILGQGDGPIKEVPTATAGLNAPPEMLPTEKSSHKQCRMASC